jgi:hypothetical protein
MGVGQFAANQNQITKLILGPLERASLLLLPVEAYCMKSVKALDVVPVVPGLRTVIEAEP